MSKNSKVIWTEGMFLRPQHFQQQNRYLEHLIDARCLGMRPDDRGFYTCRIDGNLLKIGKLALSECKGVFPDATPFNLPEDAELPLPVDIPEDCRDELVYLSLPLRRPGATETDSAARTDSLARLRTDESKSKTTVVAPTASLYCKSGNSDAVCWPRKKNAPDMLVWRLRASSKYGPTKTSSSMSISSLPA